MRVILVQHGEAVAKETDPQRPLSERGRRDAEQLATWLSQRGLLPRTIWHSGKTRARQSAALLSAGQAPQPQEGLGANDPVEPWVEVLAARERDVMLVGHLPFVGRLAARLLVGDEEGLAVGFVPGGACCVERGEDRGWELAWMLRPELFAGG